LEVTSTRIGIEVQWRSHPKNLGGAKNFGTDMFDFRRITLFCLEKTLSKHKMTMFSKNFGGHGPFGPPGYAYIEVPPLVVLPYNTMIYYP